MRSHTIAARRTYLQEWIIGQVLVALMLGLLLSAGVVAFAPAVYAGFYSDRIFPGVSVGGVDLSGLSQPEAAALLAQRLDYPANGKVIFQNGEQLWQATPRQLGLYLDANQSAAAALAVGRQGDYGQRLDVMFRAWSRGWALSPLLVYDEAASLAFLAGIAAQIDRPVIEATLSVNDAEVLVTPGQVGRRLNTAAALAQLRSPLQAMNDSLVALEVQETSPQILDPSEQAEIARRILSAPLVVQIAQPQEGDPGPWTFERQALAAMLSIARVQGEQGERYQVSLNPDMLRGFLQGLAPSLAKGSQNARFIFNDDTRLLEVIENAVIGRELNVQASLDTILSQVSAGEHNVALVLEERKPQITDDMTGEQLGITELVASHTSYFYGSSADRMQNIQTAAARFHGILIPPGATFSMAAQLGNISLENGYAEALIIYGDRTIKGVGGGVCQVSTTLFRTAFFAGFPIVERYAHAYRVGYYEQRANGGYDTNLAGLDATVFVPVVDFKFTNDTPYWLLMETYFSAPARRLTWKFYSTSDGRQVDWETTGLQNVVEAPEPLYEENSDLAAGQIKQVDWEADGADVTVYRTVTRNGAVIARDTFTTHYQPWRAIYHYGPGTEIPPP